MILAVKKGWEREKIKWKEGGTSEVIRVEVDRKKEKWLMILAYMGRKKERNRDMMCKWIEEAKDRKIILSGYFNARTGEEGELIQKYGMKKEKKKREIKE